MAATMAENIKGAGPKAGAPESKRFTPEARASLLIHGYVVYPLTGASIQSLRAEGRRFWSSWHRQDPAIEGLRSKAGLEVAVYPEASHYSEK